MASGEWSDERLGGAPGVVVTAHELKTPLSLMRQLSLLVHDSAESLTADEIKKYQQQIAVTAEQALDLAMDLTNMARLDETLFPLEPVNPLSVCRDLASYSAPFLKVYNRQVRWPKPRKSPLVLANRTLLERVLANFINNAVKYTEAGSAIEVSLRRQKDKIRLNVRDYGPAISRREYRKLVDELGQIKTVRTRPDSSGLGIFLASEFAKLMQGQIGLIRHQTGVSFFVDLPISRQMRLL